MSCSKNKMRTVKFHSGEIKYKYYLTEDHIDSIYEYFENPHNLKSFTRILSDSLQYLITFDRFGDVESEGYAQLKKGELIKKGWWIEKNNTLKKIEYFPVGDTVLINQYKDYDKSGEINIENSLFYTIDFPDTIEFGKKYIFNLELYTHIGIADLFVSKLKLSDELKWDYSNIDEAEFTYNIQEIKMNHWRVEHTFTNKKGSDTIKGGIYINSTWTEDSIDKDSVRFLNFEKVLFINKPIFVR